MSVYDSMSTSLDARTRILPWPDVGDRVVYRKLGHAEDGATGTAIERGPAMVTWRDEYVLRVEWDEPWRWLGSGWHGSYRLDVATEDDAS